VDKERGTSTVGELFKDAALGYAPDLLSNVRVGWKGLPGTNFLAYFSPFSVTKI